MKNKISRLLILVPFFAIFLMGLGTSVSIGLRKMMNTQGEFTKLIFQGGVEKYVTDFAGVNNTLTSPTITGGTWTDGVGTGTTLWNPTLRGSIAIEGTGLQWSGTSSNLYGGTHTEQMTSGNYNVIVPVGNSFTVQYGSESAKTINYRSLYGVGFVGTFSAAASPQVAWTGTLTASADPNRALYVKVWILHQLAGSQTTMSFTIGNSNTQLYPNGSTTITNNVKDIAYDLMIYNTGSTTHQIVKAPTVTEGTTHAAAAAMMFADHNFNLTQPIKLWIDIGATATQTAGIYALNIREVNYAPIQ